MNIVVAPDSFKGSLTALEAAKTMERAILDTNIAHTVVIKPMADGGEGTIDSLLTAIEGERIPVVCTGPLGEQIKAEYAMIEPSIAVIEYAEIAGVMLVPLDQRNPDHTTSFGVGEVIKDALDKGCRSFIIGLGGSATNDAGLGMLLALGMEAWDNSGVNIGRYGIDIHKVSKINLAKIDPRLAESDIKIASDVNNPLCGENGASKVYGKQKGLTDQQIERYDKSFCSFSKLIEQTLQREISHIAGAGAAGGFGFALLTLGGKIVSGAKLLSDEIGMEKAIQSADVVITGEGQSDEQTLHGKAPAYIASLAKKYQIPVILISGSVRHDNKLNDLFTATFSIINEPLSLEICMAEAESLLYQQTKQVIQLINVYK